MIELDEYDEWERRREHFDVATFKLQEWRLDRPKIGKSSQILKLDGYDSDDDIIYRTEIRCTPSLKNEGEIKRALTPDNQIVCAEVEFPLDCGITVSRRFAINHRLVRINNTDDKYFDETKEKKEFREELCSELRSRGFLKGNIRGSAKEVYVEIEG